MLLHEPLKRRPIALLWGGQAFSCVGDEVYNVALVWLAAGLLGRKAGYLTSVSAFSMVVCGSLGGLWADHWDHRKTMIRADLVRGAVVLLLPAAAFGFRVTLWLLVAVAATVSGLSAFFDPALRATVPEVAKEPGLLQASNGLMETTSRLARVVGPALVGLLNRFVPLMQFFTLDALSFFVSAWSVREIGPLETPPPSSRPPLSLKTLRDHFSGAYRMIGPYSAIRFIVMTGAVVNASWLFVLPLGMGLMIHERTPSSIGVLGMVMSSYGAGNLLSILIAGNFRIARPERFVFSGRMIAGAGFIAFAMSPNVPCMMAASAFAAVGGPLTDLGYLTLIQSRFRGAAIAKLARFTISVYYGAFLFLLLASPTLFLWFSVPKVVGACGAAMLALGLWGFVKFFASSPAV